MSFLTFLNGVMVFVAAFYALRLVLMRKISEKACLIAIGSSMTVFCGMLIVRSLFHFFGFFMTGFVYGISSSVLWVGVAILIENCKGFTRTSRERRILVQELALLNFAEKQSEVFEKDIEFSSPQNFSHAASKESL